jgi:hypothetical protein
MNNKQLITGCLALVLSTGQYTDIADAKTQAASLYSWVKSNYDGEEELIMSCLWNAKSYGRWNDLAAIKTEAASQYTWALGVIN